MADKPKLTRAERKQIEAVIRKYRGDGKPHTAQDTIPYQIMYPDGICYLGNRRYSQSIEFFDINYLLAQPDDQTAIFEYLCDLYNYLDSSIHVQFTYPNRKSDREQLARSFEMPPCNDGLDPIRQEQTDILKRQLARGNNGSVKTKYITYTIEADNLKAARARLSRISLDIQGYFKIMGAVSRGLDGKERLEASYTPSWMEHDPDAIVMQTPSRDEARSRIESALAARRDEERARRRSVVGPHADHLDFFIDGRNAAVYGSQGQRRSLVLAFKLAETALSEDMLDL